MKLAMTRIKFSLRLALAFVILPLCLWLSSAADALAQERVIKIAGFGATSGVLRQFGVNSEAAMRAAADQINKTGGVRLGDGTRAKIVVGYFDDRCNVAEGISVIRHIASEDWLAAVGPTCSSVAETLYGVLQKKADDASDSGLHLPIFTDVAMEIGLTKISDWAFRNIPDEIGMYQSLFAWLKLNHPDAKSVYGGVEEDFVHSNQTWYKVMKERAKTDGYQIKGEAKWLVSDTNFTTQVREMKQVGADVVAISAHPFTACGVLKEMQRQGVKPKVLIGLTSISSPETMEVCGKQAEGLIIPTSYAPINPQAKAAAAATARFKGYADLHSMAAWENMFTLKHVIESEGVLANPDSVRADRDRIRIGLAKLKQTEGLLGTLQRTREREAVKPFVFVEARGSSWQVMHSPVQ
ncbi:ABC transporter substrate-binding protein [Paraherbaspirillum soli]|uniref:ABC transporter substrate-binding protein n=1 Tax=Paraherbaspirillum soli TaxID=631222 RepID=A0ABW0M5C4_9BURK